MPPRTRPDVAENTHPARSAAASSRRVRPFLDYLDVVLLALAVVPALVLGAPALGFLVGAGGWVLQRVLAVADRRWTSKVTAPVRRLGVDLFEAFGRIWLLAAAIIVAAVAGSRRDGLTAAVLILCAYTVALLVRLGTGHMVPGPPARRAAQ